MLREGQSNSKNKILLIIFITNFCNFVEEVKICIPCFGYFLLQQYDKKINENTYKLTIAVRSAETLIVQKMHFRIVKDRRKSPEVVVLLEFCDI